MTQQMFNDLETSSKEQYMLASYKPHENHYCNIFDYSIDIDTSDKKLFNCVATKTAPVAQVCVYPLSVDKYVSASIVRSGEYLRNPLLTLHLS